jgi:hypothetical protein
MTTTEELKPRVAPVHSAFLYDPHDREHTSLTAAAHEVAQGELEERPVQGPVQILQGPDGAFAVEIRGQASGAAHGKQGFRPSRGELLLALEAGGIPVFLAFYDNGWWKTAWLGDLPPSESIAGSTDREEARRGWYAGDKPERGEPLFKKTRELVIPTRIERKPRAQEGLV